VKREIFEAEHDDFRATARAFFEKECAPHTEEWERAGITDRSVWLKQAKRACSAGRPPRSSAARASPTSGSTPS